MVLECLNFFDADFNNGFGVGRTQIPEALRREMADDHKRAVIWDKENTKPSESFTKGALPQTLRPCTITIPSGSFANASEPEMIRISAAIAGKSASLSSDSGHAKQNKVLSAP